MSDEPGPLGLGIATPCIKIFSPPTLYDVRRCRLTSSFRTPLALAVLTIGCSDPVGLPADEVTDWNQVLVSALTATDTSPQNADESPR